MQEYQVVIYIDKDKPIIFAHPDDVAIYVDGIRKAVDPATGNPPIDKDSGLPIWKKFEHFPLLKVVDRSTQETFTFEKFENLPRTHLINSQEEPLLIIGEWTPPSPAPEPEREPEQQPI